MSQNASTQSDPAAPAPPRDVAVKCRQVVKTYGAGATSVFALRGVDLDVYSGELLMLVGPSGCGKTTLISAIAGILDRDSGECLIFGEDVQKMSGYKRTAFRGQHIGFVFQAYNLIPALTSAENAAVPLIINGEYRSRAVAKARDLLAEVGFNSLQMESFPNKLSGGQQQRVAIARALIHQPKLVVCDEPTAALDHDTGQRVMRLLREIALKGNRSLIVVTHDARIFHYADRIARMDDGRIVSIGPGAKEPVDSHGH
jgi:putative ABC transport system ATP-binding protein